MHIFPAIHKDSCTRMSITENSTEKLETISMLSKEKKRDMSILYNVIFKNNKVIFTYWCGNPPKIYWPSKIYNDSYYLHKTPTRQ